jgi:trehalose 6-phosphate synthase/phosphatase
MQVPVPANGGSGLSRQGRAARIVFVSNRLPLVIERNEAGWSTRPGSGGLVTALVPILKRWGGVWIGWPGIADADAIQLDAALAQFGEREGYCVIPVALTAKEYEQFYQGFCNEIIWPLFHDLQSFCNFVPEYWTTSVKVDRTFADAVRKCAQPDDVIWVQDYHLMGLGKALFDQGVHNTMVFFLHIPFPPPDIFLKLPWRKEVLKGLLHYRVIGLQSQRDLKNFSDCVNSLLPGIEHRLTPRQSRLESEGRSCVVGVFPIGIDFSEFADAAATSPVEQRVAELRQNYPGQQVILGVDRLDYTKGVPYRLRSFGLALERYPELHRKVTLLQVVVPSRETVPQYQDLKAEIERLVAQINGKFTQPGWVPIHHVFRHVDRQELIAWYRLADVALVTPLKDGMNLVAKEYCACQLDGNGVLVLSEFAGAAEQLGRWAVLVNPYDIDCVATGIQLAVIMTPEERRPAMEKLRANIRDQNVYWWLSQFLRVCGVRLDSEMPSSAPDTTE